MCLCMFECVCACVRVCVKGKRLSPTSLCETLINTCFYSYIIFIEDTGEYEHESMKQSESNQDHDYHVCVQSVCVFKSVRICTVNCVHIFTCFHSS